MTLGIDVSYWNDNMDFNVARSRGVTYVMIKAGGSDSEGRPYKDGEFEANMRKASGVIPMVSVYWYLRPCGNQTALANYYLSLIRPYRKVINFEVWVDVEANKPNTTDMKYNKNQYADKVEEFISIISREFPSGIYTGAGVWNTRIAQRKSWKKYPLWIARYNGHIDEPWSDGSMFKPHSFDTWKFWQYSADGNGLGTYYGAPPRPYADNDMDLNRANFNSVEELYAHYGITGLPPVEPPPVEETFPRKVTTTGNLNMRQTPDTTLPPIGVIYPGVETTAISKEGSFYRINLETYIHESYVED